MDLFCFFPLFFDSQSENYLLQPHIQQGIWSKSWSSGEIQNSEQELL